MSIPTIAEAAGLIAGRKLSPVELTEDCLARVKQLDPTLNAFITVTGDRARAEARAAEARIMKNGPRTPLDGIPIAHKDIYNTKGVLTTAHSKLLQDNVPTRDATTVEKLAAAGTIMLGKLSTHEFAAGGPSFDLPWPPARNPWNPDHFTGGSSSGTGAAVAAGMILGGTGSDTGGSIRGPACYCGIAGIKPTYGRVSRAGILPLSNTLDHAGPLAWTAEDCALMLQQMAGHDPRDPASADRPVPDFSAGIGRGVKGLRVGAVRHFHETDLPVNAATLKGIEGTLDVLRGLGATVSDVTLPPLRDFSDCYSLIVYPEAYAIHEPWLKTRLNDYGERLRNRLMLGGVIRSVDYVQALRKRRELCQAVAAASADIDIMVTAVMPAEAPKIDAVSERPNLERAHFPHPGNITGYPAMSVCSGYGAGGLPLAVQLIAKPWQEALLLRTAHAYEQATEWRNRRPAMVS